MEERGAAQAEQQVKVGCAVSYRQYVRSAVNDMFARQLRLGGKKTVHQVHSAKRVVKAGVQRPGINQVCHTQLLYVAQPLEVWMRDKIKNQV